MDLERREITREDVNALPMRRYEGEIVLVQSANDLARAAADAAGCGVVGFDTETRPAFRAGESYLPSVFQLAGERAVYVFQLRALPAAATLRAILEDSRVIKAGVSVSDDLKSLKKVFAFEEAAVLDLGQLARRHGYRQTGVRNLAALVLGFRVPKGAKTTNWAAARLTPQQLLYAATDAWVCRELYLRFAALGLTGPACVP